MSISFATLLVVFELLVFFGSPPSVRFFTVIGFPFRLILFAILIYGASTIIIKSWWNDNDNFHLFKKCEFDALLSKDPRLAAFWRQATLVIHCTAETFLFIGAGFIVCGVIVSAIQFTSIFGK